MQMHNHLPEFLCGKRVRQSSRNHVDTAVTTGASGNTFSFESQVQIRSLREYVSQSREILDQIRTGVAGLEKNRENPEILLKITALLGRFHLEANSWGLHDLYDVAFALQKTLLESCGSEKYPSFWNAVYKGLAMMSTLLEQCESDLRRKFEIADVLERLYQTGENLREQTE